MLPISYCSRATGRLLAPNAHQAKMQAQDSLVGACWPFINAPASAGEPRRATIKRPTLLRSTALAPTDVDELCVSLMRFGGRYALYMQNSIERQVRTVLFDVLIERFCSVAERREIQHTTLPTRNQGPLSQMLSLAIDIMLCIPVCWYNHKKL